MNAAVHGSPACLTIALTGGIASGKTTVANLFVDLGVPLIDADVIARELVARGQPALAQIAAAFGPEMITAAGELDRRRMRERIFADDAARLNLEAILHPRIRAALLQRAQACTSAYCLLAIPLFVESHHAYDWVDRLLVVDVPRDTQLARLMQRDGMTEAFALRALAAQANRQQRLLLADDVIDNAGLLEPLPRVVKRLHQRYLQWAAAGRAA